MPKLKPILYFTVFLILGLALSFPGIALASEEANVYEAEINGFHVLLGFLEKPRVGDNPVHVEIVDPQGLPITPDELSIDMVLADQDVHQQSDINTAAEVPDPHAGMAGMDMDNGSSSSAHETQSAEEAGHMLVSLDADHDEKMFKGNIPFKQSGEWLLMVHFTDGAETLQVEIPVIVKAADTKYGILAGFLGLNAAIIAAASITRLSSSKKSL